MDKHCTDQAFFEEMKAAWKYRNKIHFYDNIEAALITIAKNKLKKHYRRHPTCIVIEELEYNIVPPFAI